MSQPTKRTRQRNAPNRINKGIRTARAYEALVWLLATARWMHGEIESQMHHFGIKMSEFHVLDVLRRNGPQYPEAVSRRLGLDRGYTRQVIKRLTAKKFVQGRPWRLPSRPQRKNSFDIGVRYGGKSAGKSVVLIEFTPEGKNRFMDFIGRHTKLVKAHMRAL
ncbi:MAG TPA: helix-turn-helix domain-containing protein, partial [Candidatus Acidoferrales bacterium]|nr:helix-turn-helix domain-containing protein [Candidatus Acidoferrales bacterium]